MAPLLRLAAMSDDGSEALATDLANWRAEPRAMWQRLQTPLSDATEAKVAAKVIAACDDALASLPKAEELLPDAAEQATGLAPAAERKRLAARVLLGERAALESCVAVWKEAAAKVEA